MSEGDEAEKPQRHKTLFKQWHDEHGLVRLEEWPEGIILWVGGEIRWKSWAPQ